MLILPLLLLLSSLLPTPANSCLQNQYQDPISSACISCPNFYCSAAGSTSPSSCQSCIANCLEYKSNTECKTCKTGYSVNPSDKSQCLTCTASTRSDYLYTEDLICRSECNYPYSPSQPSLLERLCILNVDPSVIESAESLGKGVNIGGILSTISGIFMSFVDKTSPSSFTLTSLTKMLQYMKFINVNYPPKLFFMLKAQKLTSTGLNFIPAMSQSSKDDIPSQSLPLKFELNGVHSSFLVGYWQPFISLIIIAFVIFIASAVEYYLKDYQQAHKIAKKINSFLKWNVFLTIFCSNYSDLAFYTAVEFASVELDTGGVPVISFVICLAVNTLGFFIVVFMMKTIASLRLHINQQNVTIVVTSRRVIRPMQDFRKQYMGYSMIFQDLKEQTWWQQIYVLVFCVRAYLYGLFVGFMYDVPVAQAVLLLILGVCMLGYLIVKRPMKELVDFIQQIFCETILLVANFCVFIMAIIDSKNPGENSSKDGFGTLILAMNLVLSWSLPVFAVVKGVLIFMKARKRVAEGQKTLPPLETNIRNNIVIENNQNNRGIVTTNQAIETFENSPTRIMPRIHLQTRPSVIPLTEFDISHYQITDNDTSMVELKRGQSHHSQLETRPVSMVYLGSGVIGSGGGGRNTQNEIQY